MQQVGLFSPRMRTTGRSMRSMPQAEPLHGPSSLLPPTTSSVHPSSRTALYTRRAITATSLPGARCCPTRVFWDPSGSSWSEGRSWVRASSWESYGSWADGGRGVVLRLSERVQAVAFVAILIVAVAGLYAVVQAWQPAAIQTLIVRHARLDVKGEAWSIRYEPAATANNTAFGILREASASLGFSVTYVPYEIPKGVFVTGINGSMNGDGGRYWQYWVDGTYGTLAADHQALHDGAVVLWTFSIPSEGG